MSPKDLARFTGLQTAFRAGDDAVWNTVWANESWDERTRSERYFADYKIMLQRIADLEQEAATLRDALDPSGTITTTARDLVANVNSIPPADFERRAVDLMKRLVEDT